MNFTNYEKQKNRQRFMLLQIVQRKQESDKKYGSDKKQECI